MSRTLKSVGFVTAAGAAVGAVALAVPATGAYFSESHTGTISGSIGQVHISDPTSLSFQNLLPGEPQTQTFTVRNTGTGPEDIHVIAPAGIPQGMATIRINGGPTVDAASYDVNQGALAAGKTGAYHVTVTLNSSISDSRLEGQSGSLHFTVTATQVGH